MANKASVLPENILGYDNLQVLADIYKNLGEKEKSDFVLAKLKKMSPPSKPKEIWVPVEQP